MRTEWIENLIIAACLLLFLSLNGCISYPRSEIGFWQQHVEATAWGFTMVTPYGPFNFGYLSWNRNVKDAADPAKPSDVLGNK